MAIAQFMPLFYSGAGGFEKDPYEDYVIMHLNMEDSADGLTLVDKSLHRNTFTRSGDAHISEIESRFGKASAAFDGTGDYYYSAAKDLYNQPGDFTIEFWVYNLGSTVTGQWSGLVSHSTSSSYREPTVLIEDSSNKLILFNYSNPRITSNSSVPLNQWAHISYGRSSGHYYIYINGHPEGRFANSDDVPQWSCTLGSLGWYRNTSNRDKLRGYIDEFRWWKGISIRDGVTAFKPPNKPWKPLLKSIFTPIEVTVGVIHGSGWNGYVGSGDNKGRPLSGAITQEPFLGHTVGSIEGYYGGPYDGYYASVVLSGEYTQDEFEEFKRKIPAIKVQHGNSYMVLDRVTLSSTGQISITANMSGDQKIFNTVGSIVLLTYA